MPGLHARCEQAGLTLRNCSPRHQQIIGGIFLVNYYPTKGTFFVDGMHKGIGTRQRNSLADVVEAAFKPPPLLASGHSHRKNRERSSRTRWNRNRMLKLNPTCVWCGHVLPNYRQGVTTVEHVIPLARGGSYSLGNLALACQECNIQHGDGVFLSSVERMRGWWVWKAAVFPSKSGVEFEMCNSSQEK